MAKVAWRGAVSVGVVVVMAGTWLVPGCSSPTKKHVLLPPDGSAGEAGAGGAGGAAGRSGNTPHGGSSGAAVTSGDGGAGADDSVAGAADAAGTVDTGPVAGSGGTGGSAITLPDIDAGSDCVAPADDSLLSPAAAGFPSTGLALWLRADRGIYMSADKRVCAWVDQSGNNFVFTPANENTRPLWDAAGVGGKAALHVDSFGHSLATGGVLGIPADSARTLIVVVKLVNTGSRCSSLQQGQANTPGTYLMVDANTFMGTPNAEGVFVENNDYSTTLATSTTARVHVYTFTTMTPGVEVLPNIDYRVNGTSLTLVRNNAGLGNGKFEDFSGANYTDVGGDCPDAFIAEALVYSRALSVPERTTVEAALEARYGIQP